MPSANKLGCCLLLKSVAGIITKVVISHAERQGNLEVWC
jgi:hypothetical protein